MAGLMISASYQIFSGQNRHLSGGPASSNLPKQIYYTLSMEILLSLLKIMNIQTIFIPHHKHCITVYIE